MGKLTEVRWRGTCGALLFRVFKNNIEQNTNVGGADEASREGRIRDTPTRYLEPGGP